MLVAITLLGAGCDGSNGDEDVGPGTDAGDDAGPLIDSGPRPDVEVMPPTGCPDPSTSVAEPYRWYPALDLARIPFHVSAGAWGEQRPVAAPEPPTTTRSVTVSSRGELETEGLVPGTEITVTADIPETITLLGDVTDLDLIVPEGITIGAINVGRASPPSVSRRVRIRGTTPGEHSGGTLGQVTFFSADFQDAILDGVDLNATTDSGSGLAWYIAVEEGSARFAIVNNRAHAAGATALHGPVVDLVIAGNNLVSGARSRESNGYPEGWTLRGGRRIVVFDNHMEGNRYHRVRVHPDQASDEYAWVADNILVDPFEARIVWGGAALSDDASPWDGFWAVCNRVHAHSNTDTGCIGFSFEAPDASYARLTNNDFYGVVDEAGLIARMGMGDQDVTSDNVYQAWETPPPWDEPGDPRLIPLPQSPDPDPQDPMCPGP